MIIGLSSNAARGKSSARQLLERLLSRLKASRGGRERDGPLVARFGTPLRARRIRAPLRARRLRGRLRARRLRAPLRARRIRAPLRARGALDDRLALGLR